MKASVKLGKINIKGTEIENLELSGEFSVEEIRGLVEIAQDITTNAKKKEVEDIFNIVSVQFERVL